MKLPQLKVRVSFDDVQQIVNEIKQLQTYKLLEDDDMILVDRSKVADILQSHVTAELAEEGE